MIPEQNALDEQFGLGCHVLAQLRCVAEKQARIRLDRIELVEVQPLERETRDQARGTWVGEHPPYLGLHRLGRAQLAGRGDTDQFVVGPLSPQEERQAGSQLDVAERMHGVGRSRLDTAVEEVRAGQDGRDEARDPSVEAAFVLARSRVEGH